MGDSSADSDELFEGSADGPISERSPDLRAGIYVLTPDTAHRASIVDAIPEQIDVQSFSSVKSYADALTGNVVVVLSGALTDEHLETAAALTVQTTNYTRIEAMRTDRKRSQDPSVFGLPRGCPKCGLAWDEWHGTDLRRATKRSGRIPGSVCGVATSSP